MPSGRLASTPTSVCVTPKPPTPDPLPIVVTLTEVTRPSITDDGQHAPALRFGDPRVMASMAAIVGFAHLIAGFDNKTLTGTDEPACSTRPTPPAGHLRPAPAPTQGPH